MEQTAEPLGILIANTGTPSAPTPEAVRAYLEQFLSNKRIAPMNRVAWWFILHAFILPRRGEASAAKYRKIWTDEGSPLSVYMSRLEAKMNAVYRAADAPYVVKYAMSFGDPSVDDILEEFYAEGISRLVVLPLYPQAAYSQAKIVEDQVRAKLKAMSWRPFVRYIYGYSDHPLYAKTIAQNVLASGFNPDGTDKLIYAFHSVPLNDIEHGDTYELTVGSSCLAISDALGIERTKWTIAYQCQFDKGREWLSPFTPNVLDREAELPEHRVFIVCPNFSIDCLETLYDIGCKYGPGYKSQLIMNGIQPTDESLIYVPCLNDSDAHVRLLTEVVRRATL